MNPVVANVVVAAAATLTAAIDSQKRNSLALKAVAEAEIGRPATACFHSHFRSKLLDKLSFDNTLYTKKSDTVDDDADEDAILHRIHPHMWSKRSYSDPPIECYSADDDCAHVNANYTCTAIDESLLTRLYGPRYATSLQNQRTASFIFNGIPLIFGHSYCLPKDLIPKNHNRHLQGVCDHIAGELEISYDVRHGRFASKCFCKWPDFFGGEFCDEYVGCKVDPTSFGEDQYFVGRLKRTNAKLINRDTLESIANIKDLHTYWNKHNGNVDLYATSPQLEHSGGPAWYCGCKDVNWNLTGGIVAGSCIADPCLPSTQYLRFKETEKPPLVTIRGTSDDRDPKQERWNCDCGNWSSHKFCGGGDAPCATIVNSSNYFNYDVYEMALPEGDTVRTIRNVTCSDRKKIFMPCRNRYRPYFSMTNQSEDFPACSDMAFPGVVNPDELPEAGACIDVCRYCNTVFKSIAGNKSDTDVCSSDNRMWGNCETDYAKNNANPKAAKYNFKCSCGLDPQAKVWDVTTPSDGPCIGKPKPCKGFFTTCTVALDRSPQGPECSPNLLCQKMLIFPDKCHLP